LVDQEGYWSGVNLIEGDGISITSGASEMRFGISDAFINMAKDYVDDEIAAIDGSGSGYEPPTGMIAMWSQNDVRSLTGLNNRGWYLCDGGANASGANHPMAPAVPDLTNMFIKGGAVGINVGTFAGSSSTGQHTLTTAQMPSHNHSYKQRGWSGVAPGGGSHTYSDDTRDYSGGSGGAGGSGSHSHPDVNPPHYVVAYIIYLGDA
jgi:hypothetical protein